jgi:hypothetical protein
VTDADPSLVAGDGEEWGHGDWERTAEQPPRPWPSSSPAYFVVMAIGLVGLVLMAVVGWGQADDTLFRPGALLVAFAVCLAGILRAVISERRAGMLVLRSRRVDVLVYSVLGIAALVLAIVVPPPS